MSIATELRKAGKLEEAMAAAQGARTEQPGNIWCIRDLAWVHYEYMKRYTGHTDRTLFKEHLEASLALGLGQEENVFYEQTAFQLTKLLHDLKRNMIQDGGFLSSLTELTMRLHVPPMTKAHNALLSGLLRRPS